MRRMPPTLRRGVRATPRPPQIEITVSPSFEISGLSLSGREVAIYEFADTSGVDPGDGDGVETGLLLRQSYPNPFGPSTTISYSLPERSHVRLGVYNVAGREVAVLQDGPRDEGPHEASWDGLDEDGIQLAAGMYFVKLDAGGGSRTSKMMLLR